MGPSTLGSPFTVGRRRLRRPLLLQFSVKLVDKLLGVLVDPTVERGRLNDVVTA